MEKTVDINEGNLFLQMPSSVGEMSPTDMPEALGFELGGNALEKLGLFIKMDEEEDEEGGSTDAEEGEID